MAKPPGAGQTGAQHFPDSAKKTKKAKNVLEAKPRGVGRKEQARLWDFWRWSSELQVVSLGIREGNGNYSTYRDYAWGVTHALGITWWLILVGRCFAEDDTIFEKWPWWGVGTFSGLLFLVWLWQQLRNTVPRFWGQPNAIMRLLNVTDRRR